MKNICLIIPPSSFLLDERVFPSLGILKIAGVLRKNKVPVMVLDLSGYSNYTDIIGDFISKNNDVNLFGITSTTPQLPAASKIATEIRRNKPSAKIILGGPHVTLTNSAFRIEQKAGISGRASRSMNQLTNLFDTIVAGDGEYAIFEAIKDNAPKIIDADFVSSPMFLTNESLNESPWPARELIDMESYHYMIDGVSSTSLIAQLGCPFNCGFCGGRSSPTFRRIRTRTSEDIVNEMVHLYDKYGYRGFMMYDDELNVNPKMIELMDQIHRVQINLGISWKLRGFIKSQLFNDAQAQAMYRAGFRWILVGFESGSEKILETINKKATRAENTHCMEIARRNGLKVKALMSVGHPGESRETIQETKNWLLENKPDDFDVSLITCYPGTPYYDKAMILEQGLWLYISDGDRLYQKDVDFMETAEYYKGDPDGGYKAFVYTDFLTSDELVYERNNLEKSVRKKLGIPFNKSAAAMQFEHSMGMGLPLNVLKIV
jgi:radical SAM superfamily enzyme YgiQ (UPF0313 family)